MSEMTVIQERLGKFWREVCQPWYAERSAQEQRLLWLAAVVLPLGMVIFGVLLPMHDRIEALKNTLPVLSQQAAEAEQLAAALKQGKTSALQGSLLSNIERMSNQAAVRTFMTHIRPESAASGQEQLMVQFKDVPYDKFIAFLYQLTEKGLNIVSARIQAASAGKVHVQMKIAH